MINNRLHYWYNQHLIEDIIIKNPEILPNTISKSPTIIINICSTKAITDKRKLIPIVLALELITGQKGLLTRAKCSLASFRLKKGMEIGLKITLNKISMWNFLDKFIHIILPSLVYFNKLKKISYDKEGNLGLGIENIDIFSEIDWLRESQHILTKVGFITGIEIIIIWNNKNILDKYSQSSNLQIITTSKNVII